MLGRRIARFVQGASPRAGRSPAATCRAEVGCLALAGELVLWGFMTFGFLLGASFLLVAVFRCAVELGELSPVVPVCVVVLPLGLCVTLLSMVFLHPVVWLVVVSRNGSIASAIGHRILRQHPATHLRTL